MNDISSIWIFHVFLYKIELSSATSKQIVRQRTYFPMWLTGLFRALIVYLWRCLESQCIGQLRVIVDKDQNSINTGKPTERDQLGRFQDNTSRYIYK